MLFGGAIGDSGRYTITADTYILDFSAGFQWKKITADNPPSARAAHASACVDLMQLVIYGGATGKSRENGAVELCSSRVHP